jgi:Zn-dependent M28 family amino/carboxypeptidase
MDTTALADRLRRHVAALAASPRPPGTAAHRHAAEYIREHLRQAGFDAYDAPFAEAGFTGINLMTKPLPDRDELPLFLVGAHYDSRSETPGADDNASGVAALVELAHWIVPRLRQNENTATRLQLVAYDLEEFGTIGSFIHARHLRKAGTNLYGMISLEMLGFTAAKQQLPPQLASLYPSVGNFIGVVGNERSQKLLKTVTLAMKKVDGLPVESLVIPGNGEAIYETRLSDHSPFWDHGYEALMITDTSFFRNPHYHRATDTAETLDYPFLSKVTLGVCEAVLQIVARGR